jgi:hypothetical protein
MLCLEALKERVGRYQVKKIQIILPIMDSDWEV